MTNDKIIILPGKILKSQIIDDISENNLPDYSKQYFTTEALTTGAISFNIHEYMGTEYITSISYSKDNGQKWITVYNTDEKHENLEITVNVNKGDKILWKGNAKQLGYYDEKKYIIIESFFTSISNFNVYGNIMSLCYDDNFICQKTLKYDYQFYSLFFYNGSGNESGCNVIDASNLILPATTLTPFCYTSMFYRCSSLVKAPELPATTLASNCYYYMFYRCSSLVKAPELPATTLAQECYRSMFDNCTALVEAPELPATTLAPHCYRSMFYRCTSLVKAPELPATTLAQSCYDCMFLGCTSLVKAPELPATTLAEGCYNYMFRDCTSLKYIKCLATDISANVCLRDWVYNILETGIFIKSNNMSNWTIGYSGIPHGWLIQNDNDNDNTNYSNQYLTFKALENTTFTFTQNALQYSLDNGRTWTTLAANNASPTIISGNTIMWKQTGLTLSSGIGTFSATGKFKVYGNIMSLYYGDDFVGQTDLTGKYYVFYNLFDNNTKLVDASNLILPSTTLAPHCYSNMFNSCTSLVKAPELPATILVEDCYRNMFYNCRSLVEASELPATILAEYCYMDMFFNCSSLVKAPKLPATALTTSCYEEMFAGCSSLVKAPKLPATTLAAFCYTNMFNGCTSLVEAPKLPATTLASNCYSNMFRNCSSLVEAPELPATILVEGCYSNMFRNCSSLVEAPELPATTLLSSCYSNMFNSCTSLVKAPELPATTLATYCYSSMFNSCTSLVKAPELPATILITACYDHMFASCSSLVETTELPATTLAENCYRNMFTDCTSLKYIKCLATDISANACLQDWVYHISETGIFIKANNMSNWTTGDSSGIPRDWTIYDESEYKFISELQKLGLPEVTSNDNGKVLMVIDGAWRIVHL